MRVTPLVGGDWPQGMEISTSVNDVLMLELLYLRTALGLATAARIPELTVPVTPVSRPIARPELDDLSRRWDEQWAQLWLWREALGAVRTSTSETALFTLLLAAPRIVLQEWGQLSRDDFDEWRRDLPEAEQPTAFENSAEYRSRHALEQAWWRGLRTVAVLPYEGRVARPAGRHSLELSLDSYRDPEALTAALNEYGGVNE